MREAGTGRPTRTQAAQSPRAWTQRAGGVLQMGGPWRSRNAEARVRTGSVPGRGCDSELSLRAPPGAASAPQGHSVLPGHRMRNPELAPSQDGDVSLRAGRCRHSGRGSDSRACPEECRSCLIAGSASWRSCQPLGIRSDRLAAQHVDSRRGHSASRMPLQCVGLSESLCSCRVSAGGSCQACLRQSCSVPGRGESATLRRTLGGSR